MLKLAIALQNLRHDRRGVTMIEYAMLAGGLAVVLMAVFGDSNKTVEKAITTLFENVFDQTVPTTND